MTPFPGMDPYLEHPDLWPGVHNSLIAALQRALAPVLRPRYLVRLEERTYLAEPDDLVFVGRPDITVRGSPDASPATSKGSAGAPQPLEVLVPMPDEVRETWLEVKSVEGGEVVTVLEVLSPANKQAGSRGRQRYEAKRLAVLGTRTNLVEVDLIRAGVALPVRGADVASDYRILIARGDRRPRAELFPFSVREPIPRFPLPLRGGDVEPLVDIGGLLHELYGEFTYDQSIDYRTEPVPPLAPEDARWSDELLRRTGLRR